MKKAELITLIESYGYPVVSGFGFDKNGDNAIVWQAGEFEHPTLKGLLKLVTPRKDRGIRDCKNVPAVVLAWFKSRYPLPSFSFDFYTYVSGGKLIYGCAVRENGLLYTNANQGSEQDFK